MNRRLTPTMSALAIGTLALLYLPMLAVAAFSVNASRAGVTWRGFTWDWYTKLFHDKFVLEAARNTLILAGASTIIATLLGTLLAFAARRFPWPKSFRRLLEFVIYLPVVTPDIVFAVSLMAAFGLLRTLWSVFQPGLATMIIAHVTFQIAFVAMVVGSRLATIGRSVEEAARDLYADSWYLTRRVMLPLLLPGIVGGAMMAFTLSLDDFVISFFTSGKSVTLPIYIYSSLKRGVSPEIHALSTLVFLVTVVLVLAMQLLARSRKET